MLPNGPIAVAVSDLATAGGITNRVNDAKPFALQIREFVLSVLSETDPHGKKSDSNCPATKLPEIWF